MGPGFGRGSGISPAGGGEKHLGLVFTGVDGHLLVQAQWTRNSN